MTQIVFQKYKINSDQNKGKWNISEKLNYVCFFTFS